MEKKKRIFARLHRSLLSPQLHKRAYKMYNPIYMVQIELSVFCYILSIFGHKESSCLLWYSSNNIIFFYCNSSVYRHNCPLHHETKEYVKFYSDVNFVFDLFCSKDWLLQRWILKIAVVIYYGKTYHHILSRDCLALCSVFVAVCISNFAPRNNPSFCLPFRP